MLKCPDDYAVIMVDFPGDILAAVRVDANGYPTVYINDRLAPSARREALKHELRHFENGDFWNHLTIYDAEKQASASAKVEPLPRSFRPVTAGEIVQLMLVGLKLLVDAEGPIPCAEPLPMPSPMFYREPETWLNKKMVW